MKIGLIAIAGVKLQTRKFIELGITLPQFVNRGQVIAQLPSLALLTLAGVTPDELDLEYVEVDDVATFAADPTHGFDLVALSTYTARAFDAYKVADAYRARGVPVVFGGLHATVLPDEVARHADAVIIGEGESNLARGGARLPGGRPHRLQPFYREARPGRFDLREAPVPRFDLLCGHPSPGDPADPRQTASCTAWGRTTASPSRPREAVPGTATSAPPPSSTVHATASSRSTESCASGRRPSLVAATVHRVRRR